MNWIRATRVNRCPVCNHDSWCTFNDEVVLCMRVQSEREKVFKDGCVGWIHRVGGTSATHSRRVNLAHRMPEPRAINPAKIMEALCACTRALDLSRLSQNLGVTMTALRQLGCAWSESHQAYAFPMWDHRGNMVGIRLRSLDGRKWAIRGSHQGIFRAFDLTARRGFVCEGPTDTAAILSIGGYAVGRPSCSGGLPDIGPVMVKAGVREAIILSDNDGPGMRGAAMLQNHLPMPSAILVLPCKDVRKFVNAGGTLSDLDELVSSLCWHQNPHS